MSRCTRCGNKGATPPHLTTSQKYEYCDDCQEKFQRVKNNGITVRSRHSNREFDRFPYEVSSVEGVRVSNSTPENQTQALATAKEAMDEYDVSGIFIYQKTGSVWLIDEYLDSHPEIAEDVEDEMDSDGFFSRLFG